MPSKAAKTVKKLAEKHNLDPKDINSEVYEERPIIAETDLWITVRELCNAKHFNDAAKAIELAVRRAYQVEGAA